MRYSLTPCQLPFIRAVLVEIAIGGVPEKIPKQRGKFVKDLRARAEPTRSTPTKQELLLAFARIVLHKHLRDEL